MDFLFINIRLAEPDVNFISARENLKHFYFCLEYHEQNVHKKGKMFC